MIAVTPRVLNVRGVATYLSIGESTVWARVAAGTFPAPVPLGEKARGWLVEDVDGWLAERIAERDAVAAAKAGVLQA